MRETREEMLKRYGESDCICHHEYKSPGKLYGISMGECWVRMKDDPACPRHGKKQNA